MKAILCKKYGPADVLQLGEADKPTVKPKGLLVNVKAVEVTKADCELRSFNFPVKWFWLPLRLAMGIFKPRKPIIGGYFSGTVVEVGDQVEKFKVGDDIFGSAGFLMGAYAQYLSVNQDNCLTIKPDSISHEQAAATPLGGLNAIHFLNLANIKANDTVLINGAGGSIGSFALQIAKSLGAKVTAIDAKAKQSMLMAIGADAFIDYQTTSLHQIDQQFDVVFDMVAHSDFNRCIELLKPKGHYLTANPNIRRMFQCARVNRKTDKTATFKFADEKTEELEQLAQMLKEQTIIPAIDQVLPPHQVVKAHQLVEQEKRLGCIVMHMDFNKQ